MRFSIFASAALGIAAAPQQPALEEDSIDWTSLFASCGEKPCISRRGAAVRSPKLRAPKVVVSIQMHDGATEKSFERGPLESATSSDLLYSVVGRPDLKLVYQLDKARVDPNTHRGILHSKFLLKAGPLGLSDLHLGRGSPTELKPDGFEPEPFAIDGSMYRLLRSEGVKIMPSLIQRETEAMTVAFAKTEGGFTGYKAAMNVGILMIEALQKLHNEARIAHGCISPDMITIATDRAIQFRFTSGFAEIDKLEKVLPVRAGMGHCTSRAREFLSPWDMGIPGTFATPSRSGDLWSALAVVSWLTCKPEDFTIPAETQDLYMVRAWKLRFTATSWECEIDSTLDPSTRELLGSIRKKMWDTVSSRFLPYDLLIKYMQQSLELLP